MLLDTGIKPQDETLGCAVDTKKIQLSRVLLSYGADARASPQAPILQNGCADTAELLLSSGAQIDRLSYTNITAPQVAKENGNADLPRIIERAAAPLSCSPSPSVSFDVSQIRPQGLCSICQRLIMRQLIAKYPNMPNGFQGYPKSLTSLQDSARHGCSFCMFFRK